MPKTKKGQETNVCCVCYRPFTGERYSGTVDKPICSWACIQVAPVLRELRGGVFYDDDRPGDKLGPLQDVGRNSRYDPARLDEHLVNIGQQVAIDEMLDEAADTYDSYYYEEREQEQKEEYDEPEDSTVDGQGDQGRE